MEAHRARHCPRCLSCQAGRGRRVPAPRRGRKPEERVGEPWGGVSCTGHFPLQDKRQTHEDGPGTWWYSSDMGVDQKLIEEDKANGQGRTAGP